MDEAFKGTASEDGVAEEDGVDAGVEAEADVREVVEAVDPDELGEGSGATGGEEGESDEHDADVEEVLDAVQPHVEVALHRLTVESTDCEPVENGSPLAEEGSGQKPPVQATVVSTLEEGNDVPRAAVCASEGELGHVGR